jgi:predicted transcriptional regulator
MNPTSTSGVEKTQFNIRIPSELGGKLEAYAEMVGQSKAQIAVNAMEDYLAWRVPQLASLKLAIAAADRGEIADPMEVERFFDEHED